AEFLKSTYTKRSEHSGRQLTSTRRFAISNLSDTVCKIRYLPQCPVGRRLFVYRCKLDRRERNQRIMPIHPRTILKTLALQGPALRLQFSQEGFNYEAPQCLCGKGSAGPFRG